MLVCLKMGVLGSMSCLMVKESIESGFTSERKTADRKGYFRRSCPMAPFG